MKPSKVYILPTQYDLQYDNGGEPYVSLNDLLEWARKRKETYLDLANKSGDGVEWGQECGFEELIDKLESL